MDETTDRVTRGKLRMTGEWVKQQAVDHTVVLVSLIESGDKKDAATIRMMAGLVVAVLVLVAVVLTLTLGGSFSASTTGVQVQSPANHNQEAP